MNNLQIEISGNVFEKVIEKQETLTDKFMSKSEWMTLSEENPDGLFLDLLTSEI